MLHGGYFTIQLPGNKMDSYNLATLFGPNILHKVKSSEKEYQVESLERAEERKDVIDVIKDMIDNYNQIFQVGLLTTCFVKCETKFIKKISSQ